MDCFDVTCLDNSTSSESESSVLFDSRILDYGKHAFFFIHLVFLVLMSLWLRPREISIRQFRWLNGLFVVALIGINMIFVLLEKALQEDEIAIPLLSAIIIHVFVVTLTMNLFPRREYHLQISSEYFMTLPVKVMFHVTHLLAQTITVFYFYFLYYQNAEIRILIATCMNIWIWLAMAMFWKTCLTDKFEIVRNGMSMEVLYAKKYRVGHGDYNNVLRFE